MIGADIGVYALARAFHERYGVISTVVSRLATGPIANSKIIENVALGEGTTLDDTLRELLRIGQQRSQDVPALLMCNADGFVRFVVDHREELSQYYVIPFIDATLLDQLSDKGHFAELCAKLDIDTPTTVIQDFSGAAAPGWSASPIDLPFPVVAKAAASSEYEGMSFEGKKKIYFISDQAELDALWARLSAAGFAGRFVVQELIPGDDTWMRSITAYCDRRGEVTLLCSAQVLLEEHTPLALGNPAAMITTALPEAMEQAKRLLQEVGYVGFANFDVKVDPRDGTFRFLEVNPRIGRNNYYVTAAGANVAQFVVGDFIEDRPVEPVVVEREILYSILPQRLLLKSDTDPALTARDTALGKRGIAHPLENRIEGVRRRAYVVAAKLNQIKKFRTYYPEPTETGF
jgi:D-aspartate ligase